MNWNALLMALLQMMGGAAFTALVVSAGRRLWTRIPRVAILPLALTLGVLAEWLAAQATGGSVEPFRALLFGTGATWLRELLNTAQQHGIQP